MSNLHGLETIDQPGVGLRICPEARGLYCIRSAGRAEAVVQSSIVHHCPSTVRRLGKASVKYTQLRSLDVYGHVCANANESMTNYGKPHPAIVPPPTAAAVVPWYSLFERFFLESAFSRGPGPYRL
jgi:hypothetical protein